MEKQILNLIKNWQYDLQEGFDDAHDGFFALAKINRLKNECTSRKSSDEELAKKYGTWEHCIEQLGNTWKEGMHSLLYAHTGGLTANISEFVGKIEDILRIKPKSKFYQTSRKTISAVKVSPWWVDSADSNLKRAVFARLLRWGRNYQLNSDIWEAIKSSKFGPELTNFMQVFLGGRTKFNDGCVIALEENMHSGIVKQFAGKSEDQIKDILLFKE